MAMSGIDLDEPCRKALEDFESNKCKRSVCFLHINKKGNKVENVDYLDADQDHTVEEVVEELKKHSDEGHWCVFTAEYDLEESTGPRTEDCKVLVSFSSDLAPVKKKMLFGSTYETVKKHVHPKKEVKFNSVDEISPDGLIAAVADAGVSKKKISRLCLKNTAVKQKN